MSRLPAVLRGLVLALMLLAVLAPVASAQEADDRDRVIDALERQNEFLRHRLDILGRQIDDVIFEQRLSEIAETSKVRLTGPPRRHEPNPTAQGAGNPFVFWSWVFIPRELDRSRPQPLIVLPHGGVHSRFTASYLNVLTELLEQGYTVVAPEYRGSTGYGGGTYRAIDYGGLETEDTWAARSWALEAYEFLDPDRVGIIGWSHGGLHALMNIFDHGEGYAVAYAGVPVSDLIARMGYKTQGYRDLYSADYHIGKTAYEDVEEYRRRSPSWNAHRYDGTPLLIHSTTNDEDVNVFEVERLIQALEAEGRGGWEAKIYDDAPGGHAFNRLDTALARESRREIWSFLAPHLRPERPVR
ncbi:MAG: alpha/beta hydrolase family protein [Acidobacteriota bacterium]